METIKRSQIVLALANMASQGHYDHLTHKDRMAYGPLFKLVAALINELEAEERAHEEWIQAQENEQVLQAQGDTE